MKKQNFYNFSQLAFISLLLVVANCHAEFDQYVDSWNALAIIQGQFDKNHTLFQNAQCNPCDYLIVLYKDYIQLLIDDPEQGKIEEIKAFQFTIQQNHHNQTFLDFDSQKIKVQTKANTNVKESIQRFTRNGLQWRYQFTLPIQGVILKGQTTPFYQYLIPTVTFLFALLIFMYLPLRQGIRQQLLLQIPRRTPLLSLIILAQAQHIMLLEIVTISIKYLIYEESFLIKSAWYCLFIVPFGFTILHILYVYDSLKMSYHKTEQKFIKSTRIRDIGVLMTFFIGLYGGILVLLLVNKSIWIFCYFGFYYVWQFGWSLKNKVYPYLSLNIYFVILIGYQMVLANLEPLFWFQQLTRIQMAIFWAVLISFYLLGSLVQKIFIGIQIVNQVLFQQSKQMEMREAGSAKSTQQNFQRVEN